MKLAEILNIALKILLIKYFNKNLFNIGLKNGQKVYSLIFKKTIIGLENCFQTIIFHKFFSYNTYLLDLIRSNI